MRTKYTPLAKSATGTCSSWGPAACRVAGLTVRTVAPSTLLTVMLTADALGSS